MLTHVKATEYLNPGQIPVMAGDLQIYMSMKKCQHMYPEEVGEDKIVCFMGFLHKEMAAQECGGVLLAGSGWEQIFVLANIFTLGTAQTLLSGKKITRTRHAYHLTLAWLHILESRAYQEYNDKLGYKAESMDDWEHTQSKQS